MGFKVEDNTDTKLDKELNNAVRRIKDDDFFVSFIFDYCESQEDRKRLLDYIYSGHEERKGVLLMASQIGIESGTVEGGLVDENDRATDQNICDPISMDFRQDIRGESTP